MVVRFATDVAMRCLMKRREADIAAQNREDCAEPKWDETGQKGIHIEAPQR